MWYLNAGDLVAANLRFASSYLGSDVISGFPLFASDTLTFYVVT
ncbi:unnamed protein product, partial [Amoebophrya sp. A25]|eukprot:GSA25T00012554001.1